MGITFIKPTKKDRHCLDECLGCGALVDHEPRVDICPRCGGGSWKRRSWEEPYKRSRKRYK
jgi:rRNA maturation endonuclease Nob1